MSSLYKSLKNTFFRVPSYEFLIEVLEKRVGYFGVEVGLRV